MCSSLAQGRGGGDGIRGEGKGDNQEDDDEGGWDGGGGAEGGGLGFDEEAILGEDLKRRSYARYKVGCRVEVVTEGKTGEHESRVVCKVVEVKGTREGGRSRREACFFSLSSLETTDEVNKFARVEIV